MRLGLVQAHLAKGGKTPLKGGKFYLKGGKKGKMFRKRRRLFRYSSCHRQKKSHEREPIFQRLTGKIRLRINMPQDTRRAMEKRIRGSAIST